MQRTLKDMVVVITGASAGIGQALAKQLAPLGARLVLSARRMDRLEQLNAQLGGGHVCVQADVSKIEDCQRLIDTTDQRFGRIDTLVCNAGYGIYRTIAETSLQETRRIFETNVFGTTDLVHFALPMIARQDPGTINLRGQIMIVSSVVARRGIPYIGMYSATKAAQLAYAEALRVELKPLRIAVTSVHPISTKTEFGKVAETMGDVVLPTPPISQTVHIVAKKMVRAIQRPRPEVWPSTPSRWVVGFGTLMPRIVDHAASKYRKQVERANQK